MIDEPNDAHDFAVASHILSVHRDGHRGFDVPYAMGDVQRYIKYARAIKPEITAEVRAPRPLLPLRLPAGLRCKVLRVCRGQEQERFLRGGRKVCGTSLSQHALLTQSSERALRPTPSVDLLSQSHHGPSTTHARTRSLTFTFLPPHQAKKVLVESYKRLRADDAVPGTSTSYRITVRQLEALVRLSQALARVRCAAKVLPQYVKEVSRSSAES